MRVKQLWNIIPLPSKIKLLWDRVTLSRTTTIYFVFSLLHCILQIIFQVQAYRINVSAANFLASITEQAGTIDPDAFYVLGDDLRLCDNLPTDFSTSSCQVVWNGTTFGDNSVVAINTVGFNPTTTSHSTLSSGSTASTSLEPSNSMISSHLMSSGSVSTMTSSRTTASEFSTSANPTTTTASSSMVSTSLMSSTRATSPAVVPTSAEVMRNTAVEMRSIHNTVGNIQTVEVNGTVQVIVNGLGWNNQTAVLDRQCLWALNFPVQVLQQTEREDITFIAFQVWVLGMSVVAILNESVPHTIASLLTHMLATGWAGYQIFNTAQFRGDFSRLITYGACNPINLLPSYWQIRVTAEIASLVLNVIALLVSAFLSWRLAKLFGWQTFKRVGASIAVSRAYKLVLVLSITIQLSLFFMVIAISLWLDQLCNGNIGRLGSTSIYKPLLIVTLILLLPWLTTGWYGVRRELKVPTIVFLALSVGYLTGWAAMFISISFRWTYMTWTFFGVMTSTSVFLALVAFILGIAGRINFGKGLVQRLNAEEPLPDDFIPVNYGDDPEKIAFPSNHRMALTYSIAFGPGQEALTPSQMFSVHDDLPSAVEAIQLPQPTLATTLRSYDTVERHHSKSSTHSSMSTSSSGSGQRQRWVIE